MKIQNSIKKFIKTKTAFTLIEVLVVVSIIILVTVSSTGLFISIVRSNRKTKALLLVKQNGDQIINLISQKGRLAASISGCPFTDNSSITIVNSDASLETFACANGQLIHDVLSTPQVISDDRLLVSDCFFSCQDLEPEIVTIKFTLGVGDPVNDKTGSSELNFSTSVSLRNY